MTTKHVPTALETIIAQEADYLCAAQQSDNPESLGAVSSKELDTDVAWRTQYPISVVREIRKALVHEIGLNLAHGRPVALPHLGTFYRHLTPEHAGVGLFKDEHIEPKYHVRFRTYDWLNNQMPTPPRPKKSSKKSTSKAATKAARKSRKK